MKNDVELGSQIIERIPRGSDGAELEAAIRKRIKEVQNSKSNVLVDGASIGYDSGIQAGSLVTLNFVDQAHAEKWFEAFMDAYEAVNGCSGQV